MNGSEIYFPYSSHIWSSFMEQDRDKDQVGPKFKDVLSRGLPQDYSNSGSGQVDLQSEALGFDELGVLVLRKNQKSDKMNPIHNESEQNDLLKSQHQTTEKKNETNKIDQSVKTSSQLNMKSGIFWTGTNPSGLTVHSKVEAAGISPRSTLSNQVQSIRYVGASDTKPPKLERPITPSVTKIETVNSTKGSVSDLNISVTRGESGLIIKVLTHLMEEDQKKALMKRLEILASKAGETIENLELIFTTRTDGHPKIPVLKEERYGSN